MHGQEELCGMLSPLEWIVIAVVVIVFVMVGPKRIPELARALGQARKEFAKGVTEEGRTAADSSSTQGRADAEEHTTLKKMAERLEVGVEGMTDEEISQEIVRKARIQK